MEGIYANVEWTKHAELELQKNDSTPKKSKRSFVSVLLGLLSFFLLAGLVGLAVFYGRLVRHSWDIETNLTLTEDLTAERDSLVTNLTHHLQTSRDQLSAMTKERDSLVTNLTHNLQTSRDQLSAVTKERDSLVTNLTHHLQTSRDQLSAVTEERDSLKTKLNEQSRELERLRAASTQRRHCPDRWTRFSGNCYLLTTQSLSWEKARDFCIKERADLVTINSAEEQTFVSKRISGDTWIGLNDRELEGTWRWAKDNSPLIQGFWAPNQPDNWNGDEDCVHIEGHSKKWNDQLCSNSMKFVCEKNA